MQNLFKLFTLVCLCSFLVSCDGDETSVSVTSENLQGEWELVSMNVDMSTITMGGGVDFNSGMTLGSTETDYTLSFNDNSWTTLGGYSYNYTVSIDQTEQSDVTSISDVSGSGSFELDGTTVTLNGAFFEFSYQGYDMSAISGSEQVVEVSFNGDGQLVFSQNDETEVEQGGISVTSVVNSTSIWNKK